APESDPQRTVVTRSTAGCDDISSRTRVFVLPKVSAGKVLPERHPIAACAREDRTAVAGDELVAVGLEKRLITTIVLRPPDVLRTEKPRAVHRRVRDQRDVEGHVLVTQTAWVPNPAPPQLAGSVRVGTTKVYFDLRRSLLVEERVHPGLGMADIDTRLAAIAKDGDKPIVWVEARWVGGVRTVVLRAAHDVIGRVYVDRQALVLERPESGVHRRDRRRHLFEPMLTVDQVVG